MLTAGLRRGVNTGVVIHTRVGGSRGRCTALAGGGIRCSIGGIGVSGLTAEIRLAHCRRVIRVGAFDGIHRRLCERRNTHRQRRKSNPAIPTLFHPLPSSEERRVGKECVMTCNYRLSPYL